MTRQLFENLTEFFSPQPERPRDIEDVGLILGQELDTMKAALDNVAYEGDSRGFVYTFSVDGKWYELRLSELSEELRAELGIP